VSISVPTCRRPHDLGFGHPGQGQAALPCHAGTLPCHAGTRTGGRPIRSRPLEEGRWTSALLDEDGAISAGSRRNGHSHDVCRQRCDDGDAVGVMMHNGVSAITPYPFMPAEPLFGSAATGVVIRTEKRENQPSDESSEVTKFIGCAQEVEADDGRAYGEEVLETTTEVQSALVSMMGICACMEDLADVALENADVKRRGSSIDDKKALARKARRRA